MCMENIIREARRRASTTTVKDLLDRSRINLMRLMCQQDVIEIEGNPSLFGGKEAIGEDISKAILNLAALGEAFGVDLEKHLAELVPDLGEKKASSIPAGKTEEKKEAPKGEGGQNATPSDALFPATGEGQAASPVQQASQVVIDQGGDKVGEYKKRFADAHTTDEVNAIWKEVIKDPSLDRTAKPELQADMTAALKKIRQEAA